jgi:tetratricopeptide (TPR) repeat protein
MVTKRLIALFTGPDRPKNITTLVVLVFVFLVYKATQSPTVSFWDCGEFIACSFILGVPHPPGSPLYIILGRLFSLLPTSGDLAARINLLSAVGSAFAAMFAFLILFRLIRAWWPKGESGGWKTAATYIGSIVGTMMFAFGDANWNNSIETEVYSVAMLLMMVIIWLTVRWADCRAGRKSDRYLALVVFLFFLSTGVHMTTFLIAPAIFLAMILLSERLRKDFRFYVTGSCLFLIAYRLDFFLIASGVWLAILVVATIVTRRYSWALSMVLILAAAAGFSIQLATPIRSSCHPSINQNNPSSSYAAFRSFLERKQYGEQNMLTRAMSRRGEWKNQLGVYPRMGFWGFFNRQYGINGRTFGLIFVLGLLGLYEMIRRNPGIGWPFLLMVLLGTVIMVWYMNFADGTLENPLTGEAHLEVRERDYFFTPGFILFGMTIGVGVAGLIDAARRSVWQRVKGVYVPMMLVVSALALLAAVPLRANYFSCDRSRNYTAYDFAYNMLVSCEPNAILLNGGDNDTFPIWALQEVYGVRPDVTAINLALANAGWYIKQVRDKMGVPLRWSDPQIDALRARVVSAGKVSRIQDQVSDEIINVNKWQRPINFSLSITDDTKQYMGRSMEGNLVMHGQVYRLQPGQPAGLIDMEANHRLYWDYFRFRSIGDTTVYKDPHTAALLGNYVTGLTMMADSLRKIERYDEAIAEVKRAIEIVPYEYSTYNYLVQLYVEAGSENLIPSLVGRVPREDAREIYYVWGMTNRYRGNKARAAEILKMTLDTFPDFADAFKEYSRLLYEAGDIDRLRSVIQRWLTDNPDDTDARRLLQSIDDQPTPSTSAPRSGSEEIQE